MRLNFSPMKIMRGFALPTAIFLLVILAFLGVVILRVAASTSYTTTLDIQGVRAYQAAYAGLEWGAYQALRTNYSCAPSTTTSLTLAGQLAQFTVNVTCTEFPESEGAETVVLQEYVATANNPSACKDGPPCANYVERQLRMLVRGN